MRRALYLLPAVLFAFALDALAQDRTDSLREREVRAFAAVITFPDDGGCELVATGEGAYQPKADGGRLRLNVQSDRFPYRGSRCAEGRAAALAAVKLELGVGDGGRP